MTNIRLSMINGVVRDAHIEGRGDYSVIAFPPLVFVLQRKCGYCDIDGMIHYDHQPAEKCYWCKGEGWVDVEDMRIVVRAEETHD